MHAANSELQFNEFSQLTLCYKNKGKENLANNMKFDPQLHAVIRASVENALAEDIGDGDLTAELVPASTIINATIVARPNDYGGASLGR